MTELYHYTECGLDNVYLENGFKHHATPYGMGVSIENVDDLHKAIALDLISGKRLLSGAEVRFLRKELDLSQEALALFLGYGGQTVARWEKSETEISGAADRLLRLLYLERIQGNAEVEKMLERLKDLDALWHKERYFREVRHRWKPAA
jgi:DNA-binding transcriptional regulator YiaG